MALPTYDKNNRRKSFEQLPKGAYVLRILGAKEEQNKNGSGRHLTIIFDVEEGEYKKFYADMFERNTNEDKKWPGDATYYLAVPEHGDEEWKFKNWNSFFADLEDSNNGFVFSGDVKSLKGKLIGGKFRIEQSENNGSVYDHTRLYWTCVAEDVRKGKAGKLPNDKLISSSRSSGSGNSGSSLPDFLSIPEDAGDDGIPF